MIISGFPGIGKTEFYKKNQSLVHDSDSSKFSKSPDFPDNYIKHIKSLPQDSIILVSSHKAVRDALVKANLDFVVVYPEKDCKKEYLDRYKARGNNQAFIDLLDKFWDEWIDDIEDTAPAKYVLSPGQYLSDFPIRSTEMNIDEKYINDLEGQLNDNTYASKDRVMRLVYALLSLDRLKIQIDQIPELIEDIVDCKVYASIVFSDVDTAKKAKDIANKLRS